MTEVNYKDLFVEKINENAISFDETVFLTAEESWFHQPPSVQLSSSINYNLPNIKVTCTDRIEMHFTVEITDAKFLESRSSIGAREKYTLSESSYRSLEHDYTANIIGEDTDIPLKKIFGDFDVTTDNLTPDFCIRDNVTGITNIIEFATTKSSTANVARDSFNQKISKYKDLLEERSKAKRMKTIFYVIVVYQQGIVTNLPDFPTKLVNELVLRYKFAQLVKDEIKDLGFSYDETSEQAEITDAMKKIIRILENIKIKDFNQSAGGVTKDKFGLKGEIDNRRIRKKRRDDIATDVSLNDYGFTREEMIIIRNDSFLKNEFDRLLRERDGKVWSVESYHDFLEKPVDIKKVSEKIFDCLKKTEKSTSNIDLPSYDSSTGRLLIKNKTLEDRLLQYKRSKGIYQGALVKRGENKHLKPVVQLPFIIPKLLSDKTDLEKRFHIQYLDKQEGTEEEPSIIDFWNDVITVMDADNFDVNIVPEFLTEEMWEKEYKSLYTEPNPYKYKRFRVKCEIPRALQVDLAVNGVVTNSAMLKDPLVKEIREKKKLIYNLKTPTSDISNFLNSDTLSIVNHNLIIDREETLDLIQESLNYQDTNSDINSDTSDFVENFLKSKIGLYSSFVSDLGTELTISLKQHCKSKEFLLKYLTRWDCYLLIKPTSSHSHLFFSLLINPEEGGLNPTTCFKSYTTLKDGRIVTDFISVNVNKLTNWVTCESRMLSSLGFFCDFHELDGNYNIFNDQDTVTYKRININLNFSLLIQLSDKDEIEGELTLTRYVMMEGFVGYPKYADPAKMIKKMCKTPRSRLTIYIIKKTLDSMKMILKGRIFHRIIDKEAKGSDKISNWKNLFHPIFHYDLKNPGQLINIFYMGYLNNKNKTPENNVLAKLYIKILEMEDMFNTLQSENENVIDEIGIKEMTNNKEGYHLYDPDILKFLVQQLINSGNKTEGGRFLQRCEEHILRTLSYMNIENCLTTLKASSNFTKDNEQYDYKENYTRSKVVEKAMEITDEEIKVTDLLAKSLDYLEDNNCMHIDIFKKNQFGGLREIYVLGIHERVCQLYVETISRSICSFFKSETMTNPESKRTIPQEHTKLTNQKLGSEKFLVVGASNDAEKWNQGHYVSKFYQMLILLTPKYMHGSLQRILRLWMRKKIKISNELLNIFEDNHQLIVDNEIVQTMYNIHRGKEERSWFIKGNNYIQTRTGMMQGILHYTSSLLHVAIQEFCRSFTIKMISSSMKQDGKVICSVLESSDDSSMIISFPIEKNTDYYKGLRLCQMAFSFKDELGLFIGIYPSVKCTQNTPFVMEFNSQFYFDNSKYQPFIKSVFSSVLISEQESIIGRQEEMNSLLSESLGSGVCHSLLGVMQYAQAFLHYRLIGEGFNPFYKTFYDQIRSIPDPTCGFFLMDNQLMVGIPGLRYNLWNVVIKSDLNRVYKTFLKDDLTENKNDTTEVNSTGTLVRKMILSFGNRKKWEKLLNRMNLKDDWLETIDENPEILYRRAKTKSELECKVQVKLHSPGVTKAFDPTNILPAMIASNIYLLNHEVLTSQSAWFNRNDVTEQEKTATRNIIEDLVNFKHRNANYPFEIIESEPGSNYYTLKHGNLTITNTDVLDENVILHCVSADLKMSAGFAEILKMGRNINMREKTSEVGKVIKTLTSDDKIVYHCVTKDLFYKKPLFSDFKKTVTKAISSADEDGHTSIHLPFIGTGRDKLNKDEVLKFLIDLQHLYNVEIVLHIIDEKDIIWLFPKLKGNMMVIIKSGIKKYSLLSTLFNNNNRANEATNLSPDEILFLFPRTGEYQSLKNLIDSLEPIFMIKSYQRRKVTTVIDVFNQEVFDEVSADRIIAHKWFDIKTNFSQNRLNMKFNKMKTIIKWLRDRPAESLELSPFENHVQMQNYFARTNLDKRVVRILGAPLVTKSGKGNLKSSMSLNYGNRTKINFDVEKENLDSHEVAGAKHEIMNIISMPYNDIRKTQLVEKILLNRPTIHFNPNNQGSRTNTLSIMQDYLTSHDKDRDERLFENIKINRNGIIGAYEQSQRYSKELGKYTGIGIWRGIVSGHEVRIFINESKGQTKSSIMMAHVSGNYKTHELHQAISDWCKDNETVMNKTGEVVIDGSINNTYNRDSSGLRWRRLIQPKFYLNKEGVTIKKNGFPVFEKEMTSFDPSKIRLTAGLNVHNKVIHLQAIDECKTWGKKLNLLKYNISSNDYLPGYKMSDTLREELESSAFVLAYIIENKELPTYTANEFIKEFVNNSAETIMDLRLEDTQARQWLKDLTSGSLSRLGFMNFSNLMNIDTMEYSETTQIYDNEVLANLIGDFSGDFDTMIKGLDEMDEMNISEDNYDIEEDLIESYQTTFGETKPVILLSTYSLNRQKILFDSFIKRATQEYSEEAIRNLIEKKIYTTSMLNPKNGMKFLDMWCYLLNRDCDEYKLEEYNFNLEEYPIIKKKNLM